jgi:hypothetical protein
MNNYNDFVEKYNPEQFKFFYKNLIDTGLPFELNQFTYMNDERPAVSYHMVPDANGDIRFYVRDIHKNLAQYAIKNSKNGREKHRDWYLTRFEHPVKTKAGIAKYMPCISGVGMYLMISPNVFDAIKSKTEIPVLYVIEGYKKALSAATNGLYAVGMSGLTGFSKTNEELPTDQQNEDHLKDDLKAILKTGLVKRVALVYDGDLVNLSVNADTQSKETYRPNNFYRGAVKAKKLFEPFCDCVLVHPKSNGPKGLDDLFASVRNYSKINSQLTADKYPWNKTFEITDNEAEICTDLNQTVQTYQSGKFFGVCPLSGISDYKIKEYFYLDSPDAFYKKHREKLVIKGRFWFYNKLYSINPDNSITLSEDQAQEVELIEEINNKLYVLEDKGRRREIANFTLKVLYQVQCALNPLRVCESVNFLGEKVIVELTPSHFASANDFKKHFLRYHNFVWRGKPIDLDNLMVYLFRNEETAISINRLGLQDNKQMFAFSNAIVTQTGVKTVDENGIVEHEETKYYLPYWSRHNPQNWDRYQEERKFAHITSSNSPDFLEWKTLVTKCFGKNGNVFFTWVIAAMFSDIVYRKLGFFPLFFAGGQPQSGKTTMIDKMGALFGRSRSIVSLSGLSTPKFFANRFAQVVNGFVHLDEFGNNMNAKIYDFCKDLYNRIGYGTKAFTNDNQTNEVPVKSGAAISGEIFPTANYALFTRTILTEFANVKFTADGKENFQKLEKMNENGITQFTVDILMNRVLIAENFETKFSTVYKLFAARFKTQELPERILKNAASVFTPLAILLEKQVLQMDLSEDELLAIFFENVTKQADMGKENTDMAKFWDYIELAFAQNIISEDKGDFKFKEDCLVFRLNRFHDAYVRMATERRENKILNKSSLENYLTTHPAYVPDAITKDGRRCQERFSKGSSPVPAWFFRYESLGIDLKRTSYDPTIDDATIENNETNIRTLTPPQNGKQTGMPF